MKEKEIDTRKAFLEEWSFFERHLEETESIRSIFNQHFKWEFKIKYRETSISEYPSKQIREISEIINFFILNYIKIFEIWEKIGISLTIEKRGKMDHSILNSLTFEI